MPLLNSVFMFLRFFSLLLAGFFTIINACAQQQKVIVDISSKDYSCCVGDQLYIYHYYTSYFLWIPTGSGYTSGEPIGEPSPGGCNIQCPPTNEIN